VPPRYLSPICFFFQKPSSPYRMESFQNCLTRRTFLSWWISYSGAFERGVLDGGHSLLLSIWNRIFRATPPSDSPQTPSLESLRYSMEFGSPLFIFLCNFERGSRPHGPGLLPVESLLLAMPDTPPSLTRKCSSTPQGEIPFPSQTRRTSPFSVTSFYRPFSPIGRGFSGKPGALPFPLFLKRVTWQRQPAFRSMLRPTLGCDQGLF